MPGMTGGRKRHEDRFSPGWLRGRAGRVLDQAPARPVLDPQGWPLAGPPGAQKPCRPAAVLIPVLVSSGGEMEILLTLRAGDHPHHAGQVSFPGGVLSPADRDVAAAALRETREETGIAPGCLELLGGLAPHRTGTGFEIWPQVALVREPAALAPCAREVAELFTLPFERAMDAGRYRRESRIWNGHKRQFLVFDHDHRYIWGATAAILNQFRQRLMETP